MVWWAFPKLTNGTLVFIERPDTVYVYTEAITPHNCPTIFACVALNILEADALFKEKFGKLPGKYVGCSFVNRYTYL
jgi:hypothetical protein